MRPPACSSVAGAEQLRLIALLGGTRWLRRLKERHAREAIVIAGTAAGAVVMSTPMIYQGRDNGGMRKDETHATTGLQFLRDVAIDTHFGRRGRLIRLARIIATNPAAWAWKKTPAWSLGKAGSWKLSAPA